MINRFLFAGYFLTNEGGPPPVFVSVSSRAVTMTASTTWRKIKIATKLGVKPEPVILPFLENVPDGMIYQITPAPQPVHRHKIIRNEECLGEDVLFDDSWINYSVDVDPDPELAEKFVHVRPVSSGDGNHTPMSHSECNTDKKVGFLFDLKTEGRFQKKY